MTKKEYIALIILLIIFLSSVALFIISMWGK